MLTPNAAGEWDIVNNDGNRPRGEDPKEKRRIQNRIAQRVYRDRMKARMSELQAKLDRHERENEKQQQCSVENENEHSQSSIVPGATLATASTNPKSPAASNTADGSSSPMQASAMQANTPQSIPTIQHNSSNDTRTDRFDASVFNRGEKNIDSPPTSDHAPKADSWESAPHHHSTGFDTKMMPGDCVCSHQLSQGQLQHCLSNVSPNFVYHPVFDRQYNGGLGISSSKGHTHLRDSSHTEPQYIPAHSEKMDFSLDTVDVWKQSMTLLSDTSAVHDGINYPQIGGPSPSVDLGVMDNTPLSMSTPDNSSVDPSARRRRGSFGGILDHIHDAGFESFDALVTAYYIDDFGDGSPLANTQRLSRNRRLPKVLMDLFDAAQKWTAWERRGFHEEILKNSGSMLTAEGCAARNSLLAKLSPMLDEQDELGQAYPAESLNIMKKCLQDEVPNFWAFAMEMAADNTQSRQRDPSNTALAVTLLLNFAGRIPHNQLLRLIDCCL